MSRPGESQESQLPEGRGGLTGLGEGHQEPPIQGSFSVSAAMEHRPGSDPASHEPPRSAESWRVLLPAHTCDSPEPEDGSLSLRNLTHRSHPLPGPFPPRPGGGINQLQAGVGSEGGRAFQQTGKRGHSLSSRSPPSTEPEVLAPLPQAFAPVSLHNRMHTGGKAPGAQSAFQLARARWVETGGFQASAPKGPGHPFGLAQPSTSNATKGSVKHRYSRQRHRRQDVPGMQVLCPRCPAGQTAVKTADPRHGSKELGRASKPEV